MKVIFSHGKESGPWGSKIKRLAETAQSLGCSVDSIDYAGIVSPEDRVNKLNDYLAEQTESFVLVGSSMGGYVSITAAEKHAPVGLFLLAPALYIKGYINHDYYFTLPNVEIVHGWDDDIIPYQNSVRYAEQAKCTLHLIDGDHRLSSSLDVVNNLFERYLKQLIHE